jgi:hypothetical protein
MRLAVLAPLLLFQLMAAQGKDPCRERGKTEDSTQFQVVRLKLSSEFADYSPRLFRNKLFFVSGRNELPALEFRDKSQGGVTTDIFEADLRDSITALAPKRLPGNLNNRYHQGPFCLNLAGDKLYYTSNDDSSPYPKLFVSTLSGEKWSAGEPLEFCTDSFVYSHPSLSASGDTLWFSSDMPGGEGGMDICYSVRSGAGWKRPVNAGKRINSEADDKFPASLGGDLYFASNRKGSMGGLDLYALRQGENAVIHLPTPLNSTHDDFAITFDSTGSSGYVSSNRSRSTGDDIYYFRQRFPDLTGARQLAFKEKYCYLFFDTVTQELRDTATFEFEWSFGDGSRGKGIRCRHCYTSPGDYKVELLIVQKVSGEVFQTQASYDLSIVPARYLRITSPDSASRNGCLSLGYEAISFSGEPRRHYWFFGDGTFSQELQPTHAYKKPGTYLVSLYVLTDKKNKAIEKILTRKEITVRNEEKE